jgi:hypothetical protein
MQKHHGKHIGGVVVKLHAFLTLALLEVNDQLHTPAANLPLMKEPYPVPL